MTKNFVTVEGRTLYAALKMMRRVIERRTTIPILSAVRITYAAEPPPLTRSVQVDSLSP